MTSEKNKTQRRQLEWNRFREREAKKNPIKYQNFINLKQNRRRRRRRKHDDTVPIRLKNTNENSPNVVKLQQRGRQNQEIWSKSIYKTKKTESTSSFWKIENW